MPFALDKMLRSGASQADSKQKAPEPAATRKPGLVGGDFAAQAAALKPPSESKKASAKAPSEKGASEKAAPKKDGGSLLDGVKGGAAAFSWPWEDDDQELVLSTGDDYIRWTEQNLDKVQSAVDLLWQMDRDSEYPELLALDESVGAIRNGLKISAGVKALQDTWNASLQWEPMKSALKKHFDKPSAATRDAAAKAFEDFFKPLGTAAGFLPGGQNAANVLINFPFVAVAKLLTSHIDQGLDIVCGPAGNPGDTGCPNHPDYDE